MLGSMLDNTAAMPESNPAGPGDDVLADLMQATEASHAESDQRQVSRSTDNSAVTIQAASTSLRGTSSLEGRLRDAGCGGVGALTNQPLAVGDVYLLSFENSPFESDQVFARCMHCRLIQEDAFESGFAFFAAATLRQDLV